MTKIYTRLFSSLARSQIPKKVKIVEVGPRDGLQNEKIFIPTPIKIDLINRLSDCGLQSIEATSFVSPKWVPQMADNLTVYEKIKKNEDVHYPVLIPNLQGFETARKVGIKEIAVFSSASEAFAKKNTNCSIQESMNRATQVASKAVQEGIKVRGYISCVAGCPYQGQIESSFVAQMAKDMIDIGCYEVSLGDTIGIGNPKTISQIVESTLKLVPAERVALHCHDTYGMALANILTALSYGISVFDSSVGGLGGCPFAKGATGNVATEDVVYMLDSMNIETGIDLKSIMKVAQFICSFLEKEPNGKVYKPLMAKNFIQNESEE